jgi:sugar phosphate isomerase/epimerase
MLDASGLVALGDHVGIPALAADFDSIIEQHKTVGCKYLGLTWQGRGLSYGTPEFDAMIALGGEMARRVAESGIIPVFHNGAAEFKREPSIVDLLMDSSPELNLEPDLGWMVAGHVDPVFYLDKYRTRTPIIHLKDIYIDKTGGAPIRRDMGERGFEFRPTGFGIVDFPSLMPWCMACEPEWMVVDHDLSYERDTYEDLQVCLDYTRYLVRVSSRDDGRGAQ